MSHKYRRIILILSLAGGLLFTIMLTIIAFLINTYYIPINFNTYDTDHWLCFYIYSENSSGHRKAVPFQIRLYDGTMVNYGPFYLAKHNVRGRIKLKQYGPINNIRLIILHWNNVESISPESHKSIPNNIYFISGDKYEHTGDYIEYPPIAILDLLPHN